MSEGNVENTPSLKSRRAARIEEIDRDLTPVYIGSDRLLADALMRVVFRWARQPAAPGGRLRYLPEVFEYGIRIAEGDVGPDNFQRLIKCINESVKQDKLNCPYIYEDSSWALSNRSLVNLIDDDPLGGSAFDKAVQEYKLGELEEALKHATQLNPGKEYDFLVTALDQSGKRFISANLDNDVDRVTFWPFFRSKFSTHQGSADQNILNQGVGHLEMDARKEPFPNPPKIKDEWFEVIEIMMYRYKNSHNQFPNQVQAWSEMWSNPPDGYGLSTGRDSGRENALLMGDNTLGKKAFFARLKRYGIR